MFRLSPKKVYIQLTMFHTVRDGIYMVNDIYEVCSKKDRTFAIKTSLLILQHFKHCPPQSSPLYWQYTVPNVSPIFGMPPGTHFK